tara:strand:- start:971 stop:1150 length:180 start_codon:yes stop_codon:yes gene_type:complete
MEIHQSAMCSTALCACVVSLTLRDHTSLFGLCWKQLTLVFTLAALLQQMRLTFCTAGRA